MEIKFSEKLRIERRSAQEYFIFFRLKCLCFYLINQYNKIVELDETYYGQNFCVIGEIDKTSKKVHLD